MRYIILSTIFTLLGLDVLQAQENLPLFRKQVIDDKITIGYGLAIGDVDGDKKPDIIVADKKQIAWYRNGDWSKSVIAENLTENDNVCVAAMDLDGDGKVEIAVGAQWNPGETSDSLKSGAVFFLKRPAGSDANWQPVKLHHEPTVHRMKWIRFADGNWYLVVVPLHGRENKQGEGRGAKILAYKFNGDGKGNWPLTVLDSSLHMTHNFVPLRDKQGNTAAIFVASKEGVRNLEPIRLTDKNKDKAISGATGTSSVVNGLFAGADVTNYGSGEIGLGNQSADSRFISTIEPMHGTSLVIYDMINGQLNRTVVDTSFNEGHGLTIADFLGLGNDQVVAGWRQPNKNKKIGLKLYARINPKAGWKHFWLDEDGIAVEDVQATDLNGDGKIDIIASGRSTHNVVIYWNEGMFPK
ncbi:MAG: hypothetical protein EOO94_00685 [Pedobacter sp.]|nr:MAG: hypothetical protein EOO94_00685 [Pedobacter sp.]